MGKLAIYYELDDEGIDTGRVQVVDEDEDLVLGTYANEPEAEERWPECRLKISVMRR